GVLPSNEIGHFLVDADAAGCGRLRRQVADHGRLVVDARGGGRGLLRVGGEDLGRIVRRLASEGRQAADGAEGQFGIERGGDARQRPGVAGGDARGLTRNGGGAVVEAAPRQRGRIGG